MKKLLGFVLLLAGTSAVAIQPAMAFDRVIVVRHTYHHHYYHHHPHKTVVIEHR